MTLGPGGLRALARRDDPALGISERFLQPAIGAGRSVAVLSEPLEGVRRVGFVVCHSLGLEQIHLARLDVQMARALSSAGFPVLRYHGQGYGDSDGVGDVGLGSHTDDAESAVRTLIQETGVGAVGLLGARFGGSVAAITATRSQLAASILIEPVVDGRRFIRDFLRSQLFADWTARVQDDPSAGTRTPRASMTMEDVHLALAAQGWADIRGFRLSRTAYDDIEALDLVEATRGYGGAVLVLAVSRSGRVRPDLTRLAEGLGDHASTVTLRGLMDRYADTFGQYNLRMAGGSKHDTLSEVGRDLATEVVTWCVGLDEEGNSSR